MAIVDILPAAIAFDGLTSSQQGRSQQAFPAGGVPEVPCVGVMWIGLTSEV